MADFHQFLMTFFIGMPQYWTGIYKGVGEKGVGWVDGGTS